VGVLAPFLAPAGAPLPSWPWETRSESSCPVDGCEYAADFPLPAFSDPDEACSETSTSLHLQHPNHPSHVPEREPLKAFADDSIKADFHLGHDQLEALRRYIAQRADKGYSKSVGLAWLDAGYVKILFYDVDGKVVDKELLFPLYGNAAMPDDPTR